MAKIDIDLDDVAKLAELLQRTGLSEIEIAQGDMRIRVARQIHQTVEVVAPGHAGQAAAVPAMVLDPHGPDLTHPGLVTSPMVGTAYLCAEPGAAPFVSEGQDVREGATLVIIEAMKVMNQIRAPRAGRVIRIHIDNAVPVEFGEPLLTIE